MSNAADKKLQEGWEAILRRDIDSAEELFAVVTREQPEDADGWNGMGAVRFEKADLDASLVCYEKALQLAKKELGGKLPKRLAWDDHGKPALRAIHGIGLNQFRRQRYAEAIEAFETLLELNPEDNQGASFLLEDARKKKSLWKK